MTLTADLNDAFRRSMPHQHCFVTKGVISALGHALDTVIEAVRQCDTFTPDNDPYGEHDFGCTMFEGHKLFWKIDVYADNSLTYGAEDRGSSDCVRVLTIMLADEY
jgi:Protein of unknown function (DUF3768)